MRSALIFFLLCTGSILSAQSIELRGGRNGIPGNYLSIGYEHYSNYLFNLSGRLFAEGSMINGLRYKAIGVDALAEYGSNQDDNAGSDFAFRVGLGATGQIESEPWIYGGLRGSQKTNYGFVGVLSGEWWMSENFCLSAFVQQKYLFNSSLGHTRSAFGLGLKLRLQNN
ncbi:MAG: hypothetical protein V4539_01310 [Bacteroidota bacterium]